MKRTPSRKRFLPAIPAFLAVGLAGLGALAVSPSACLGEAPAPSTWASEFYSHYVTIPDVTYKVVGKTELKLDIYQRSDYGGPVPTLFFVHGGAWVHQSKADVLGNILPWLQLGWTVVNVDYRLALAAPAPAAVEDCRCALRWVAQNARKYQFDLQHLVISGASAGGEIALAAGLAPASAGLDQECPGGPLPQPAAYVNWSGVMDVRDLLVGPHRTSWAVLYVPEGPGQEALARQVSPITYVRPGLPPILTFHGDADQAVPYQQAVRFHAALTQAGVPNRLFTIPKGRHGGYSAAMDVRLIEVLREFLAEHHLSVTD